MYFLEVKNSLQILCKQILCNHLSYHSALPEWASLLFLQYSDHLATGRCFNIDSVTMFWCHSGLCHWFVQQHFSTGREMEEMWVPVLYLDGAIHLSNLPRKSKGLRSGAWGCLCTWSIWVQDWVNSEKNGMGTARIYPSPKGIGEWKQTEKLNGSLYRRGLELEEWTYKMGIL